MGEDRLAAGGRLSVAGDAEIRARLEALRAAVEAEETDTADSRAPVMLDQSSVGRLSRMDAMQMQAMAAAQSRRRATARARIAAALARLDAGTYGLCAKCEEEIEEARLAFDPATPLCLACARGDERA